MTTAGSRWAIDPVHSSVEVLLESMGFSTYRTGFRALEGLLEFAAGFPAVRWVRPLHDARGRH